MLDDQLRDIFLPENLPMIFIIDGRNSLLLRDLASFETKPIPELAGCDQLC